MSIINKLATLILPVAGMLPASPATAGDVKVVDSPERGINSNYNSFRAPLQEAPLAKLPVGAVRPEGWLRKYLELQRDGLNGHLGEISSWLDKKDNQWLSDHGDHGWEEVPYWLRGYSSLAYILDDEDMKREAQIWFDAVLSNIKEDGFLGPRNHEGDNPELWAQMVMLWALQTYYEHSGDPRVIQAMSDYFKWEMTVPDDKFLKGLWQEKRGGDNLWSLMWLYNQTGDESVLPLADKLHRNTSDWTMPGDLPNWHGVNVAQGFREPALYYMCTGDEALLKAAYDNHFEMRKRFGQVPGGMYGADENARPGYDDPRQGAETCALVEQMASDEIMMHITGDPFWADHCEDVAFNTFPAAMMPDMRSLRYITSPNMAVSDEKLHGPSIDNNLRGMLSMSPFSSRCCQHNHGMGWPYYAEHLVMATGDGGLATMLYSSSETDAKVADGRKITLYQSTEYPFDGKVEITLSTESDVTFPLYLRIPSWAEGASVKINGKRVKTVAPEGRYVRVERVWKSGDKVELDFPMSLAVRRWDANKGSVSLNYGPLTLSLQIDEIYSAHDSRDRRFVQDDSHWQEGVDASAWESYTLTPGSQWNYALVLGKNGIPENFKVERRKMKEGENPFTHDNVPLQFTATGTVVPGWGYDSTGMTDILPDRSSGMNKDKQRIRLIPMGAARLRISAFPVADTLRN